MPVKIKVKVASSSLILAVTTFTVALYVVSRLDCLQLLLDLLYNNNTEFHGWGGGVGWGGVDGVEVQVIM